MKNLIAMVFVLATSQQVAFASDDEATLGRKAKALLESLDTLVAVDLSCTEAAQCVALPIGAKACGGASSYIVASRNNSLFASETLSTLASMTTEVERELNRLTGAISDCSIEMPPALTCVRNTCAAE